LDLSEIARKAGHSRLFQMPAAKAADDKTGQADPRQDIFQCHFPWMSTIDRLSSLIFQYYFLLVSTSD
jgi:hypothetical protein